MRKIITTTMLTIDGVMQAPSGSKEDASERFKLILSTGVLFATYEPTTSLKTG